MEVTTTNNSFYYRTPRNREFLLQKCLNSKCNQQVISSEVSNIFRLSHNIIFIIIVIILQIRMHKLRVTFNAIAARMRKMTTAHMFVLAQLKSETT
jgi:hypothetical protein